MASVQSVANVLSSPIWAADYLTREHLLPGGAKLDASQFAGEDAVLVTVGANAAGAATSITVTALLGPIPAGTTLFFGGTKFALTVTPSAIGATTLTVAALPTALVSADAATYAGIALKAVRSGTLVSRTYAERDAFTGFGPAVSTDDEAYLVVYDVPNLARDNDVELYRHDGLVKENFLPGFAALSAALKVVVRARYDTTIGRA